MTVTCESGDHTYDLLVAISFYQVSARPGCPTFHFAPFFRPCGDVLSMLPLIRRSKLLLYSFVIPTTLHLTLSACDRGIMAPRSGHTELASFVLSELSSDGYDSFTFGMKPISEGATLVEDKSYLRSGRDIEKKVRPGVYKIRLDYFKGSQKIYAMDFCENNSSNLILRSGHNVLELTVCDKNKQAYEVNVIISPTILVDELRDASGSDTVFNETISHERSWYVKSGEIYYSGQKIRLKGVNWFGFDTEKLGLHGLWSGRSLESFLRQIKSLGFNALRIPLSPQALDESQKGSDGYISPVAQLEDLMQKADDLGLYVLYDFHNCHYSLGHTQGRPDQNSRCPGYDTSAWLSDLEALAKLSKPHPSVVGIDLFNEPYELTWSQWRQLVNEGSRRVLEQNPRILIFVEGVGGSADQAGGYQAFWGENLVDALREPVDVPKSRLVFAPHVYGPSVYEQDYFSDANFPANMEQIWDIHFGFLASQGYPVAVGEFGGKYTKFIDQRDVQWQKEFVSYLQKRSIHHFFYWSLNSNSADTNGILESDWQTVDKDKMELLAPLLRSE